jgi:hypothetical protein
MFYKYANLEVISRSTRRARLYLVLVTFQKKRLSATLKLRSNEVDLACVGTYASIAFHLLPTSPRSLLGESDKKQMLKQAGCFKVVTNTT